MFPTCSVRFDIKLNLFICSLHDCDAAIKSLYELIYVPMVICNIIMPQWAAAVARTPAGQWVDAAPSIMFIIHYTLHSAQRESRAHQFLH